MPLARTGPPMERKASFPPITADDTRLLVLGSLPGEASLRAQRYYAHPTNQFWRLIGGVIGCDDFAALPYDRRLAALRSAQVGLWDVVASARREGSLDTALREIEGHGLADLIARLPALHGIAFNGGTAARIGRRLLAATALPMVDLPSSSAAYTLPLAAKQERWLALREFLR